ncbi:MAG: flagellar biosynthesis protein FlhB [Planctomycetaceae bacterium]|nr:flagellar biosynthesis protein FlhB [Planctomycetaceae bacterium]
MGIFDEDDGEKTEEATPRKRQEAREKGQVPISNELIAALTLIGWFATFLIAGGSLFEGFGGLIAGTLEGMPELASVEFTPELIANELGRALGSIGWSVIGLIAPLFALTAFAGYGQIGLGLATKALELKPEKLNPLSGMEKLFSLRGLVRTLLSLAKLAVIFITVALTAWSDFSKVVAIESLDLGPALVAIGQVVLHCTSAALVAILVLALADMAFQRYQHHKELRMTKKEVKEEMRSSEGDPQVKARIRRMQREMASRRMMSDVPKATVVITNPTHYAVALQYDREAPPERRGAPKVVAKGVDAVAQRIKEVAREASVTIYEDVPLARALHARCEIGDEVPAELYQAVAEVLAYVYGLEKGRPVVGA